MNENDNEPGTNIDNIEQPEEFFHELYANFNKRNIEAVIANLADDVQWANGMEGGFVYGHAGVREYWTRQFTMVSAQVTPMKIEKENEVFKIEVHQVVHDMNGNLLANEVLYHSFHFKKNKISLFEIVQ